MKSYSHEKYVNTDALHDTDYIFSKALAATCEVL